MASNGSDCQMENVDQGQRNWKTTLAVALYLYPFLLVHSVYITFQQLTDRSDMLMDALMY